MKTCGELETDFYKGLQELTGEDQKYKERITANMATLKAKVAELKKRIDSLTEDAIGADLAGDGAKAEKARRDATAASVELEQLQREIRALSRAETPARLFKKLASELWSTAKQAHKAYEGEEKQRREKATALEKEIEERKKDLEELKNQMYSHGPSEIMATRLWEDVRSFIFGVVAPVPEPADELSAQTRGWEAWEIARMIRGDVRTEPKERKPSGVPYVDPFQNGGPREIHHEPGFEGENVLNRRTPTEPEAIRKLKEGDY